MSWLSEAFDKVFDPGKKDREQANRTYQQSVNQQIANEQYWKDIANKLLYGEQVNPETGVIESKPGQDGGAMGVAKDWEGRFFDYLETAPDLTYNAQRGVFERSMQDAEKQLRSNLNARGLSNTVLGASKMGELLGGRAAGLANLEGQRQDRRGQMLRAGTSLASNALDRALNVGKAGVFGSQVPQLQQGYSNYLSSQAAGAGTGIGQSLIAEGSRNLMDNMFKKSTVQKPPAQQSGGLGQNVLMRYLSGGLFG